MSSSTVFPPPSFFLSSGSTWRRGLPIFLGQQYSLFSTLRFSKPELRRACPTLAERGPDLSWDSGGSSSEFNGWAVVEHPVARDEGRKGLSAFVVAGIGASLAVLLAAIAQFSLSRQGFTFHSPLNSLQGLLHKAESQHNFSENTVEGSANSSAVECRESSGMESVSDVIGDAVASETAKRDIKLERVIIPAAVGSTQQEALKLLRSLKILKMVFKLISCAPEGNMHIGWFE